LWAFDTGSFSSSLLLFLLFLTLSFPFSRLTAQWSKLGRSPPQTTDPSHAFYIPALL
jgi:hypothetical protein